MLEYLYTIMRNEYNHFPNAKRLFYRALHIVVICILMCVGAMPLSAQVYSTAQRYTPYDSHTNAAYGASYNSNGYAEQPAYNSYQSTVYQPFESSVPSDNNPVHSNSQGEDNDRRNAPTNRRNLTGGGDAGDQEQSYPVGDPWVMLLFAAAAALAIFVRQRKAVLKE